MVASHGCSINGNGCSLVSNLLLTSQSNIYIYIFIQKKILFCLFVYFLVSIYGELIRVLRISHNQFDDPFTINHTPIIRQQHMHVLLKLLTVLYTRQITSLLLTVVGGHFFC